MQLPPAACDTLAGNVSGTASAGGDGASLGSVGLGSSAAAGRSRAGAVAGAAPAGAEECYYLPHAWHKGSRLYEDLTAPEPRDALLRPSRQANTNV